MPKTPDSEADAVRYVVLRKLASGMRHTLMGELQAIQFAGELAAQMVATAAHGSKLRDAIDQIPEQTKAAVRTSRSIMEWLRPEDTSNIAVEAAVQQCLKLAGDDWSLRGIKATTSCESGNATVPKNVFCELFVTSLLALTDLHPGSLDIDIVAKEVDNKVVVKLSAHAADRRSALPPLVLYRALTLDDVSVLAKANEITCACHDATVILEFQPSAM
jgi:signal transduction histidine kinase